MCDVNPPDCFHITMIPWLFQVNHTILFARRATRVVSQCASVDGACRKSISGSCARGEFSQSHPVATPTALYLRPNGG